MASTPSHRSDHVPSPTSWKPTLITGASAWRSDNFASKKDFTEELTVAEQSALSAAADDALRSGRAIEDLKPGDFDLTGIAPSIDRWRNQVFAGRGFVLLKGFPVNSQPLATVEAMYLGLGTHFGEPVSQSNLGERIGHVVDVGGQDRRERAYRNARELSLHTDRCDVVGMLCVRKALKGGISGYTSAHTILNAILETHPDLLEPLVRGFQYHRFGEQAEGLPQVTEHRVPIFSEHQGRISVVFLRTYIEMAAEELGTPLTSNELAALDLFEQTAHREDLKLQFTLEPGEAIFFNNCTMIHNRTAFENGPDPAQGRHLMRLWLMAPDRWPLGEAHARYKGHGIVGRKEGGTYYTGAAISDPIGSHQITKP